MAKVKLRDLGVVSIIHDSGMVETNKGIRANIKAEKGDKLVMDENRKISIVVPKAIKPKPPVKPTKPDVAEDDNEPTLDLDVKGANDEEK